MQDMYSDENDVDEFGIRPSELTKISSLIVSSNTTHFKRAVSSLQKLASLSVSNVIVISRLYPLLVQYITFIELNLLDITCFNRATCKLDSVLCSIFSNIFQKGFCISKVSEDEETGKEEEADGMGVGEGQGKKDVSNEIEDQDEVEGMKNEKQEESGAPIPEEKDAVEMDTDFDGVLEDLETDEKEEEKSDGEGSESDEDQDMNEEMGDLDARDADVVVCFK